LIMAMDRLGADAQAAKTNRRSLSSSRANDQSCCGRPLFTFAVYLGAVVTPSPHGLAGAALGLVAIFLPGILVLMGMLPFWATFRTRPGAQAMMRGINAAVVGLLGAAPYNRVWTSSRHPGMSE
jgi:hypothetical protein